MGNTQHKNYGNDDDGGWCAAPRDAPKHGTKPKLKFQRRNNANIEKEQVGGGLCAAPRVACLDGGNGNGNDDYSVRNKAQMTEWEKRKDMLKQRIRNKLNNAYNPDNSIHASAYDTPCTCRGLCVCQYKKAAKISDSAKNASDAFDARLKKIKDQIKKEKQRERNARRRNAQNTFVDV